MDTTSPGTDRPSMDPWKEMLRLIQKAAQPASAQPVPVIAVIEAVGPRPRHTVVIGDIMACMLRMAGAVGFLTNGSIRDLEGVRAVPMACWGAGLSPMHGRIRWIDVNSPVVIDGMTVRPGDVIHADLNGAVAIPPDIADRVYDQGRVIQENERKRLAHLREVGLELQRVGS
jgi:regulator of RNase E activity RraA